MIIMTMMTTVKPLMHLSIPPNDMSGGEWSYRPYLQCPLLWVIVVFTIERHNIVEHLERSDGGTVRIESDGLAITVMGFLVITLPAPFVSRFIILLSRHGLLRICSFHTAKLVSFSYLLFQKTDSFKVY